MKRRKLLLKVQNIVEYALFRSALYVIGLFPYKSIRQFCIDLFIFAGYYIGVRKKIASNQLRMVFPKKNNNEINKLLKETYRNLGITLAEIYFGSIPELVRNCHMENLENLTDVLALGHGAVVCTGHFGNWELAMHVLAAHGIKMAGVVKRQRNPYFDDYTYKWRTQCGIDIIYKDEAGRNIIKALRENKIVVLLIDQNAGKDGIVMDFLGHPSSTFKGAAKIALHGNIPIVSAFLIRDKEGNNIAHFEPPIYPDKYTNTEEGVLQLTKDVSRQLEDKIMEYPHLWFWLHRRWKGVRKVGEKERRREGEKARRAEGQKGI
jgi:Kdo2-lipid IVA lauroyltransferase/acyltransferase